MASFDDWLEAYDHVYRTSPGSSDLPCPNCGRSTLRLVFTGPPDMDVGYASFWCDTCLEGIHISRAVIPAGAIVRSLATAAAERVPAVPDYHLAV
ncbi:MULTISPECIES: hypothetical protein [Micromonospora]|uniref:hypothetical protein n=1 Tax=Micromonospora TaxID=1873 RepID=UPI000B8A4ED5|nr:hypothetical protein [Micromonospora yangpuensis]GGM06656.1 hypothetical protein GCM10012279_25710 [Micromonospora yangpuensis]